MTPTEEKAAGLLRAMPMTRYSLECKLGVTQQQTALILKSIGAHQIGKSRPPVYAMERPEAIAPSAPIGRVSSVWDLGRAAQGATT